MPASYDSTSTTTPRHIAVSVLTSARAVFSTTRELLLSNESYDRLCNQEPQFVWLEDCSKAADRFHLNVGGYS